MSENCCICGSIDDIKYPADCLGDNIPLCHVCFGGRWDRLLVRCEYCDSDFLRLYSTRKPLCEDCEVSYSPAAVIKELQKIRSRLSDMMDLVNNKIVDLLDEVNK